MPPGRPRGSPGTDRQPRDPRRSAGRAHPPRTLRKFPALTLEAVGAFIEDIEALAVMHADVPKLFTLARDPKDEPYITLALAAGTH
jgi:hypothetical protein